MTTTPRAAALNRRSRSKRNKEAFKKAVELQSAYSMPRAHGVTTVEVLQECLERVVAIMRFAASEADRVPLEQAWVELVDRQGNTLVEPNQWLALEAAMRAESIELSVAMENLGVAERQVALAERTAEQIAPILMEVLDGVGLTAAQKRKVPGIVRSTLVGLEGGKAA